MTSASRESGAAWPGVLTTGLPPSVTIWDSIRRFRGPSGSSGSCVRCRELSGAQGPGTC